MLETLRSGKSMSALSKSQGPNSGMREQHSETSSSHSISSTPSPRNWYRRTLDRFISQPGPSRQSGRLHTTSTSIRELTKKTSRSSLLSTNFIYRHRSATQQSDIGQRHESFVQLPGTPGGHSCRPVSYIAHEATLSSLDLLTPDQSGISSDSGGPVTPHAASSIYSVPTFTASPRGQVMGNFESKLAEGKVSKIIRKPVSGLLKRKKSHSESNYEISTQLPYASEPTGDPDPAPGSSVIAGAPTPQSTATPTPQPAATQPKKLTKSNSDPNGPLKLRQRADSGQIRVPRRRSSLTALHLDSSHFEKPLNSVNSEPGSRGIRATSFSDSLHPVVNTSGSSTAVASASPQEGNSSGPHSPDLPSFPTSIRRPSNAASSTSQPRTSNLRFPQTWPDGDPIVKPAPLSNKHYQCSRGHKLMIRERAMFNQIPCMACGIDDKKARCTCQWCELRLCERCMRQFSTSSGRRLAALVKWVAENGKVSRAGDIRTPLKKGESKETLKQKQSTEVLLDRDKRARTGSTAQSIETVKDSRSANQPQQLDDPIKQPAITTQNSKTEKQNLVE